MGYKLSDDKSTENVVQALKNAISNKITSKSTIHNSDRGLQYCSSGYQKVLKANSIIPSMTEGYDCYQNALEERVNGILKNEFLIYKCNNRKELQKLVKESIHTYNVMRPHIRLYLLTPEQRHKKPEVME